MEELIKNYLNGTCKSDEFDKAIELLCRENRSTETTVVLREHWDDLQNHPSMEAIENKQLLDRIHYRIDLEESKAKDVRMERYRKLLRWAAVLVVGLLGASAWLLFGGKDRELPAEYLAVENVTVPYGAKTNFTLPDGSEVWLNSGSTLTFPKYYKEVRKVRLSGQAFFKVSKSEVPFIVDTRYGNVEVTGTVFNVTAYNDREFETTLVEGGVKVESGDHRIQLQPGQQAVLTSDNRLEVKEVDAKLFTSWKEGKLIFVNEPFYKVAKQLERWYNVKIELQGERLKQLGYTGTIEMETFSEVLELINTTTPIQYTFNKKNRVLHITYRY